MRVTLCLALLGLAAFVAVDAEAAQRRAALKHKVFDPNMTPFVRQTVEGFWEGGVPNWEDPEKGYSTNLFAAEGEAKAWVYGVTGAIQPLQWARPPGLVDTQVAQVAFAGVDANNANYENENETNEVTNPELDRPIIDAELAHTQHQSYHDTWDHMSTINANGRDHGTTKEIQAKKNAVMKAKRAANWKKAGAVRHLNNGGLDKLGAAKEKTAAKSKYSKERQAKRYLKYGTWNDRQNKHAAQAKAGDQNPSHGDHNEQGNTK